MNEIKDKAKEVSCEEPSVRNKVKTIYTCDKCGREEYYPLFNKHFSQGVVCPGKIVKVEWVRLEDHNKELEKVRKEAAKIELGRAKFFKERHDEDHLALAYRGLSRIPANPDYFELKITVTPKDPEKPYNIAIGFSKDELITLREEIEKEVSGLGTANNKCERCGSTERLGKVHIMGDTIDFFLCYKCANDVPDSCSWLKKYCEKIRDSHVPSPSGKEPETCLDCHGTGYVRYFPDEGGQDVIRPCVKCLRRKKEAEHSQKPCPDCGKPQDILYGVRDKKDELKEKFVCKKCMLTNRYLMVFSKKPVVTGLRLQKGEGV